MKTLLNSLTASEIARLGSVVNRDGPRSDDLNQRAPISLVFPSDFRFALIAGTILVASGCFHLIWLWITNGAWEGPLSPRKPGLFGLSAGVTIWSIAWVIAQLTPWQHDRLTIRALGLALLIEVGLITLQFWRGVPSHFNRTTRFDASVETIMLMLILGVTAGIAVLTYRSCSLPPMDTARALAIRAGLWFLLVSCGLGLFATIGGEINQASGRPAEYWGAAGVLKYPHGSALHAIQVLPLLVAIVHWLRISRPNMVVWAVVFAHLSLMAQALWQTLHGRGRWDFDMIGGILFALTALLIVLPVAYCVFDCFVNVGILPSTEQPFRPSVRSQSAVVIVNPLSAKEPDHDPNIE